MIKGEDIVNKQFSRAFWGYDIGEVDEFLDDIVRSNERMEQELEVAQLRIKMLLQEIEAYTGKPAQAEGEEEDGQAPVAKEAPSEEPTAAEEPAGEPAAEADERDEEEENMQEVYIRNATLEDLDIATEMEQTCFPPQEAASRERIEARLKVFPNHFWLAEVDGRPVGFINGMTCERRTIVDDMFEDASMHDEAGEWQSVMSIGVIPEYQCRGIAAKLMQTLIDDARAAGRKGCTLTCKDRLIHYYAKFGYKDEGLSVSEHGGAVWYDMVMEF